MVEVDVLTLLAPGEVLCPPAREALEDQGFVRLRQHFVEGRQRPGESRVETIARARNEAKRLGSARFALFLDRDVVLPPRGIEKLVFGLAFNPGHAALGINYQGDPPRLPAAHVAMGAVLFHRSILQQVVFRSAPGRCECSCCCEDLRRMGYEIDYLPGLRAEHFRATPL
jgi:hypothetical protein